MHISYIVNVGMVLSTCIHMVVVFVGIIPYRICMYAIMETGNCVFGVVVFNGSLCSLSLWCS